jgi:uncharacterized protein (DUF1778 family)
MRADGRKDHPLSMRFRKSDIAIIDRAAGLRGRSRTDFVREAALREAGEVLMERTVVRMSPEAFRAAINAPAAPVREMVELLRRPAPWETGSI